MELETVERLDHLGIVAGTIDELGIVKLIDELVGGGKDNGENITVGEVIKGLIINGLGFSDRPLSLVPLESYLIILR
jgi:transposase